MCGRYTLYSKPKTLAKKFALKNFHAMETSYNFAPTEQVTVIFQDPYEKGNRIATIMRWGLIPSWRNNPKSSMPLINARLETIDVKPSFRQAIKFRRCLIPADGFYEWGEQADRKNNRI